MAAAPIARSRPEVRSFPKLRHLLLLAFIGGSASWWVPRAKLAWRLHDASTQMADYALCMAGPTGAVLLRDEPAKFWQLVRRRIVAASAEERPLAACGAVARELTGSSEASALHEVEAREFADWGSRDGKLQLTQLAGLLPRLDEMARGAWPFVRGGAALLMKPSLGAKEAVHPMPIMQPGSVRGLSMGNGIYRARRVNDRGWFVITSNAQETKAFRSRDQGHTWAPTSPWQSTLQDTANRCVSDGSELGFALEPLHSESALAVKYFKQDFKTGQSKVPRPMQALKALACDETAALLLMSAGGNHWELWLCGADRPCRMLPSPAPLQGLAVQGIDVARQRGANVVAVTQGPVVRVLSTRDDGRSYTPFSVAIDHREFGTAAPTELRPAQLLAVGSTLLLIQERPAGKGNSLAVSSADQGASWRAWGNP